MHSVHLMANNELRMIFGVFEVSAPSASLSREDGPVQDMPLQCSVRRAGWVKADVFYG